MTKLSLSIVGDTETGEILIMSIDPKDNEIKRIRIPEAISMTVAMEIQAMLHNIYEQLEGYNRSKGGSN